MSCVFLSSPLSLFLYHLQTKIGLAAFLCAFCPCLGRRLAHRGSCYNFHFLNVFLFFFFSAWNQEGYFIPLCSMKMKGEGSKMAAHIQAAVTPTLANIKCKLHVAAGSWWRVCGVVWKQWGRGSCV